MLDNMRLRQSAQETDAVLTGEIRAEGDSYISSLGNGASQVVLPPKIGKMMHQILRIQDKVRDRLEIDDRAKALVSLLNCRKTAALAGGTLPPREAVLSGLPKLNTKSAIREALDDPFTTDEDGILDMLRDVERLLRAGAIPTVWTPESERITTQLRDGTFPKIVHVFAPNETALTQSLLAKIVTRSLEVDDLVEMGFIHSFIVTGKGTDGTYHCFHKQGPSINEKIEVTSLDDLFAHQFGGSMKKQYLTIVGDLDTPQPKVNV